jgi:hypothetical protein
MKKTVFTQWAGFILKEKIELEKGNYCFHIKSFSKLIIKDAEGKEIAEREMQLPKEMIVGKNIKIVNAGSYG